MMTAEKTKLCILKERETIWKSGTEMTQWMDINEERAGQREILYKTDGRVFINLSL